MRALVSARVHRPLYRTKFRVFTGEAYCLPRLSTLAQDGHVTLDDDGSASVESRGKQ